MILPKVFQLFFKVAAFGSALLAFSSFIEGNGRVGLMFGVLSVYLYLVSVHIK